MHADSSHVSGRAVTNVQKRNWDWTYIYILGHRDGRFCDVHIIHPVAVNGLSIKVSIFFKILCNSSCSVLHFCQPNESCWSIFVAHTCHTPNGRPLKFTSWFQHNIFSLRNGGGGGGGFRLKPHIEVRFKWMWFPIGIFQSPNFSLRESSKKKFDTASSRGLP